MPDRDYLSGQIGELKRQMARANSEERLRMRPEVDKMVRNIRKDGTAVPRQLQALHNALLEEAIEAQFDNMSL